jgi:hypothetical protein
MRALMLLPAAPAVPGQPPAMPMQPPPAMAQPKLAALLGVSTARPGLSALLSGK